ncbi:MAG: hypothetical protein FVQ83_04700 [Chloroflexi bacterium]|nr:hypothetical protein [Chloroflexota bacterium]
MTTHTQPQLLFVEGETSTGSMELFPSVWSAAENLSASSSHLRHEAIDQLEEMGAPRLSPLIAYLFATRLTDEDLSLRARVVESLGNVLNPDDKGNSAPDKVRSHLVNHLSQIRQRTVYSILQVAAERPDLKFLITRLLNICPYAGNHLASILADRSCALEVRKLAALFIGEVGFLDAIPTLKRLKNRLDSRQTGQGAMPFAPPSMANETELLPEISQALVLLSSP